MNKKNFITMLFALVMLSSCNNMGNKSSNDVASLFEKYKHMEGVMYADQTAPKDSTLAEAPKDWDASTIEALRGIKIEIMQFDEVDDKVIDEVNKDIASLKGYKKVDPSTFFKEVPPSMKEMFEEMQGYAKTENGATVDRLVVIDGCALTLLHIEGEIEDKDLRLVMNIM